MFNENDLRFAAERLKHLEAVADQARRAAALRWECPASPLWVRVLSVLLDRSHWMLVPKHDYADQAA